MKLQDIYQNNNPITYEGINSHKNLAKQVQIILNNHKLLEKIDGIFGPKSIKALKDFQKSWNISEFYLGKVTAKALIEKTPTQAPFLVENIIKAMNKYKYPIDNGDNNYNICFVEGLNKEGIANNDKQDEWNDLCVIFEIVDNVPKLVESFVATCEPGLYYTINLMNPKGCARICFGSYKSWKVGIHKNHEALIQAAPVKVTRDKNRDGNREGDTIEEGLFALNIHSGFNLPVVGKASAGCLAIQLWNDFYKFMSIIKTDSRYLKDKNYLFRVSVLPAESIKEVTRLAVSKDD